MPIPPVTFPTTPLKVKVEVALGADLTAAPATWGWFDATAITYTREPIAISRGRPDESSTADSSQLNMTGDNRGGHWSTRYPTSPWYGLVRKGAPVRVSVEGYRRFSGFLTELPPRWDVSGYDRYAPVVARGLLYRLAQGKTERSAMTRSLIAADPAALWTLEDGSDATQGASSISGGLPLTQLQYATTVTPVEFGDAAAPGGAGSIYVATGNQLSGVVTGCSTTQWSGFFAALGETAALTAPMRFVSAGSTTARYVDVTQPQFGVPSTKASFDVYDSAFGPSAIFIQGPVISDEAYWDSWHDYGFTLTQSGTTLSATFYIDGVLAGTGSATATMGAATEVRMECIQGLRGGNLSHIGVLNGALAGSGGASGYAGEQAHTRFLRLCDEASIPASTGVTESMQMGPQGIATVVDLMRECEATDSAYLYEGLDFDLIFQGHRERDNMAASLALNYTTAGHVAPPLEPTDDDQSARNDIEVKRDGGSSARLAETSATVENSVPNIGRRDESITLSLYDDTQPQHAAGWRLHQGTWPGYRYPTVALNLAAGPSLIPAVCTAGAAGLAFRTTIANPPADIASDPPDLLVEGYTETLGQFDWDIAANCSPFGPWRVAVVEDTAAVEESPRVGSGTAVLAADISSSDLSLSIATGTGGLWTTLAADFPLDIQLDGERIRLSAISGSSSPQTFTVSSRSINSVTKSHLSGASVEPWSTAVVGL